MGTTERRGTRRSPQGRLGAGRGARTGRRDGAQRARDRTALRGGPDGTDRDAGLARGSPILPVPRAARRPPGWRTRLAMTAHLEPPPDLPVKSEQHQPPRWVHHHGARREMRGRTDPPDRVVTSSEEVDDLALEQLLGGVRSGPSGELGAPAVSQGSQTNRAAPRPVGYGCSAQRGAARAGAALRAERECVCQPRYWSSGSMVRSLTLRAAMWTQSTL